MKKVLFLIFVSFSIQSLSHAKQKTSPGGTDGCGLGWKVTKKKSLWATSVRGITNLVVPPTFGMTTGTIGCDRHSYTAIEAPAVNYVATNFNELKYEIATGQGSVLTGLSEIMGCSDTKTFSQSLKYRFNEIFPHEQVFTVEAFRNIQKVSSSNCQI